jgi:hypothetical protein
VRSLVQRRAEIIRFGKEWTETDDNKVPEDYAAWIRNVGQIFGTLDSLEAASREDITRGVDLFGVLSIRSQSLPRLIELCHYACGCLAQ